MPGLLPKPVMWCGLILGASLLSGLAVSEAAGPLAVDVVTLKSGKSYRGAMLGRSAEGPLIMAVTRDWLQQADGKNYARHAELCDEQQRKAWEQALARLEPILADPPDAQRYVFFLKQERQRLEQALENDAIAESRFLTLEIPLTQIARQSPATPERRRLALFAWDHELPNVETQDAQALQRALQAANIDLQGPPPDLTHELPARLQTPEEWGARLAILQYTLTEPFDFQGMGDTLVRTGEGQPVDFAAILPKLLSAQVDSLLGDLLEPGVRPGKRPANREAGWQSVTPLADKERRSGFRVTRLDLQAEQKNVTVHTEFVVKLPQGKWQAIWSHVESANGNQARPELEAKIAQDPQVKGAISTLKGLGLGGDEAVTAAFRVGAATMSAQERANAQFTEFRERYARRIDGPALAIPGR